MGLSLAPNHRACKSPQPRLQPQPLSPQAAARINPSSSVLACYCGVAAHRMGSLKQALAHLQVRPRASCLCFLMARVLLCVCFCACVLLSSIVACALFRSCQVTRFTPHPLTPRPFNPVFSPPPQEAIRIDGHNPLARFQRASVLVDMAAVRMMENPCPLDAAGFSALPFAQHFYAVSLNSSNCNHPTANQPTANRQDAESAALAAGAGAGAAPQPVVSRVAQQRYREALAELEALRVREGVWRVGAMKSTTMEGGG
jgi:hypothetical protein